MDGGAGDDVLFGLGGDDRISGDDELRPDRSTCFRWPGRRRPVGGQGPMTSCLVEGPAAGRRYAIRVFRKAPADYNDTDGDTNDDGVLDKAS